MAFAANNAAAAQYMTSSAAPTMSINVISCYPDRGTYRTKVSMRVTSQTDVVSGALSGSAPFFSIFFGSQRCPAQAVKDSQEDRSPFAFTVTAEAPQFGTTTCASLSNVPLTLVVESANGSELARASNAGVFSYHDPPGLGAGGGGVGVGGSGDTSPPGLSSPKTLSPAHRASPPNSALSAHTNTTSPTVTQGVTSESTTNTFVFPSSASAPGVTTAQTSTHTLAAAQGQGHTDYITDVATYNQQSNNMMSTYRSPSLIDPYARGPTALRSTIGSGWSTYGTHADSMRSPVTNLSHAQTPITRGGYSFDKSAPLLQRTSTLAVQGESNPASRAGYNPYGPYHAKATLKINGDLGTMAEIGNWTHEEWENRRRLVVFKKQQTGTVLSATFKPVSVAERPPHSICISCIWWEERRECFVTSVDTLHLLEQLLAAPARFSVEEKNRIRRNLEGFHPQTVSKSKAESEEFFKVIMGFPTPKPRNIEKDIKVYAWKNLDAALKKIISKYSASTASLAPPINTSHLLTPVSLPGSYPTLPPPPITASSSAPTDSMSATSYAGNMHQHQHPESMTSPSPRPLSRGAPSWIGYGNAAGRTMSPAIKTSSPMTTSGLRINTLPAVYDSRGSPHSLTSPYSASSLSHHMPSHQAHGSYGHSSASTTASQTRSWDNYGVTEGIPSYGGHSQSHVYNNSAYGDGVQRA